MSDQIVGMASHTKETGRQFSQSYQSVWMSRWKRTGCNLTAKAPKGSANTVQKMKLDCAMGEGTSANKLKIFSSVKRHEGIVTKTVQSMNEDLRVRSESLGKEGMEFQDLPIVRTENCGSGFLFKLGQDTDDMGTSRCSSGYKTDRVKAVGCETEIQFPGILASHDMLLKTCNCGDEGTLKKPIQWIQSHSSGKDSTSAASKCLPESFVKSFSDGGPFIFERERLGFDNLISSNQFTDAKLRRRERECHHYHELDSRSRPRNSVTVCFRESNTSSFFDPPPMHGHHMSAGGEWFQEMQKFSGFRLLPSHLDTSEKTEVKKSFNDRYSLLKVPKCTHNVETTRISTNVESLLDPGGSCPRFCQEIQSLRITKKTDVNLENDIFTSTRMLGDTPCHLCNMSPLYGQGKRGLKIQSLSYFTNVESKGNHVKDSEVTAKYESSVQEKDPLSGATSTPSKKGIKMDYNSSRQTSVAFSKHAELRRSNTELPDMNLNLRPMPATITSSQNGDPPSSRTQSWEMDIVLTHAKQPKHQSSPSLYDSPVAYPGNRPTKRLKLSPSRSATQGTKSSSKDETSFQEKPNDNFGSIQGSAVVSSEPTLRKPQGRDQYLSANLSEKGLELLLSQAWIQRWQHNGSSSTKNKSSTTMFCDHLSSNVTRKGVQNEQFPSIAAMALMGRAMSVFQPCELQKRGSLTVWNARAL